MNKQGLSEAEAADMGNLKTTTSLMKAIQKGNKHKALDILKAEDLDINFQNKGGNTALVEAILNNQPEIANKF